MDKELFVKIIDAFYDHYGDEDFTIQVQDIGKTLQNHINHEKGLVLSKAIKFTIEYMNKEKSNE